VDPGPPCRKHARRGLPLGFMAIRPPRKSCMDAGRGRLGCGEQPHRNGRRDRVWEALPHCGRCSLSRRRRGLGPRCCAKRTAPDRVRVADRLLLGAQVSAWGSPQTNRAARRLSITFYYLCNPEIGRITGRPSSPRAGRNRELIRFSARILAILFGEARFYAERGAGR